MNPIYDQNPRPLSTPAYDEELQPYEDANDIPLLRRDAGTPGTGISTLAPPMPGGMFLSDDGSAQDNNIHYGRIPQRVPRRYKTIKRVE